MHEIYAQVLKNMIEAGKQPHEAVAALKKNLEKHGRSALLPKIARAFERLAAKEARKNTVVLTVAKEKDAAHALKEAQHMLTEQGVKQSDIVHKIDSSLIGGWRLEGRGLL